jgi:hypothetical protein
VVKVLFENTRIEEQSKVLPVTETSTSTLKNMFTPRPSSLNAALDMNKQAASINVICIQQSNNKKQGRKERAKQGSSRGGCIIPYCYGRARVSGRKSEPLKVLRVV